MVIGRRVCVGGGVCEKRKTLEWIFEWRRKEGGERREGGREEGGRREKGGRMEG